MANAKLTKPIVIWIEDNKELELHADLKKWLSYNGIELCHVKNIDKLAEKLHDVDVSKIRGFIVDMMLDGPNNLSSFGMPHISWNHDIADAGKILLEHVLKKAASPYVDIPILVLSVRMDLSEDDFKNYSKTTLIVKRNYTNPDWHKSLKHWVGNL